MTAKALIKLNGGSMIVNCIVLPTRLYYFIIRKKKKKSPILIHPSFHLYEYFVLYSQWTIIGKTNLIVYLNDPEITA